MKLPLLILCTALSVLISACGDNGSEKKEESTPEEKVQRMYQCPMKCVEPSVEPGKCPRCGMDKDTLNQS